MGDPLLERREPGPGLGARVERPVGGAVGVDQPGALGRVAAGLPHVEDHVGGRAVLDVTDAETLRDHRAVLAGLRVHAPDFPCPRVALLGQRQPRAIAAQGRLLEAADVRRRDGPDLPFGEVDDVERDDVGAAHQVGPAGVGVVGQQPAQVAAAIVGQLHDPAGLDLGAIELALAGACRREQHVAVVGGEVRDVEVEVVARAGGSEFGDSHARDRIDVRLALDAPVPAHVSRVGRPTQEGEREHQCDSRHDGISPGALAAACPLSLAALLTSSFSLVPCLPIAGKAVDAGANQRPVRCAAECDSGHRPHPNTKPTRTRLAPPTSRCGRP